MSKKEMQQFVREMDVLELVGDRWVV